MTLTAGSRWRRPARPCANILIWEAAKMNGMSARQRKLMGKLQQVSSAEAAERAGYGPKIAAE
jgi:hypothetical protein